MLTEYEAQKLMREERRKLMQEFKHEPAYVVAVILKCAAGLLIIAGVALFGAKTELDQNASPKSEPVVSEKVSEPLVAEGVPSRETRPSNVQRPSASPYRPQFQVEPYSKQVFDERRRRYIEAYPDSYVARQMGTTARQKDTSSDGGYMAYSGD